MSKCIYTGVDESTGTFESEEHIFPKCIGGVHTLPKGWVIQSIIRYLVSSAALHEIILQLHFRECFFAKWDERSIKIEI